MSKIPDLFEYVGAIHIHTKDSDGSKTHKDIIRIANRYHLDFLIFTDHMTMAHKEIEGWHERLLCLVGYEIHDEKDENHYLALGLDETLPEGLSAPEYVRRVRDKHGIGIIAHPDEVRTIPEVKAYPWTAWNIDVFDGIEVWNHMSAWLEGLEKNTRFKSFLHPRSILGTPSPETLRRWDEAARKRRILGVGSLDAHAATYKYGPFRLTLFPYKVQLQSIRTHVLSNSPLPIDDLATTKKRMMHSFKNANVFISNYRWGNARGFRFWCESKKFSAIIGESMSFHPSIVFKVEVPEDGTIRLIRDGMVVATAEGKSAEFPVDGDGAYRVEVLKGDKGWIYSNHIKIFPSRQKSAQSHQRPDTRHGDEPSGKHRRRKPQSDQQNRPIAETASKPENKPGTETKPKGSGGRRPRRPRNSQSPKPQTNNQNPKN